MTLLKRQMQLDGIARPLIAGPLIVMLAALAHGERTGLLAPIKAGLGRFFALWWTNVVTGLITIIGLICLVIPGIYFGVIFSLAEVIAALEKRSGSNALHRSTDLAQGHFWKLLGLIALAFLVPAAVGISAGVAVELVGLNVLPVNVALDYLLSLLGEISTVTMFVAYWHLTREETPAQEAPAEPGLTPA